MAKVQYKDLLLAVSYKYHYLHFRINKIRYWNKLTVQHGKLLITNLLSKLFYCPYKIGIRLSEHYNWVTYNTPVKELLWEVKDNITKLSFTHTGDSYIYKHKRFTIRKIYEGEIKNIISTLQRISYDIMDIIKDIEKLKLLTKYINLPSPSIALSTYSELTYFLNMLIRDIECVMRLVQKYKCYPDP
jgi:hypothetical protein